MKLSSRLKKIFSFVAIAALIIGVISDFMIIRSNETKEKELTESNGKTIAVKIQAEFTKLDNTLKLIEDLYEAEGDRFLEEFHEICSKMLDDDLAIGSLYFAPGGVIQYSAPEKVVPFTDQFNMLEDPVQGPKAQYTVESKTTTIAGPHDLIEGGRGLILRRPVFKDGEFYAMLVSVINTEDLFVNVNNELTDAEKEYHFAIYKGEDKTAEYDEFGYIYNSGDTKVTEKVVVPFDTPNDHWFLVIEPIESQNVFKGIVLPILLTLILYVMILVGTFLILRHQELKLEMIGLEEEQKRMEQELRYQSQLKSAMEAAQRANAAKTDFLSRMSHDIRTPINGIVGMTHIMEKKIDDKTVVQDSINKTKDLTHQLELLINDVLEMSRIESGRITLAHETINIVDKIDEIRPAIATLSENHNVMLAAACLDIQHENVITSPVHLHRIIMNVFTNAVKYNKPGGSIKYWIHEHPVDEKKSNFEIIVKDTGIGMSEEFLKHMFEPFSREEDVSHNERPGTGLGMAITKELVEMMGGTIDVKSKLGEGTTITISIPFEISKEAENIEKQTESFSIEGKHILLVEDNELNMEVAEFILQEENAIVDVATNGQEAVEVFGKSEINKYDLILMDLMMPIMNGFEATKAIRKLDREDAESVVIIAMSANAFKEDVDLCLEAGMNDHIAKPINVELMKKTIAKYI